MSSDDVRARALIQASWDTVWGTLVDYNRLAAFIPGMKSSRVLEQNGNAATVEQLVAAGRNAEFFLTTEKDAVKFDAEQLPLPCYRVPVNIAIDPLAPLVEKLSDLLAKESAS